MFKEDVSLKQTSSATHQVMLKAKQSLKNHSIVCSLTDLSPIVSNETCWSGKLLELTQMKHMHAAVHTDLCIFNQLIVVCILTNILPLFLKYRLCIFNRLIVVCILTNILPLFLKYRNLSKQVSMTMQP
jgi:hypothetical protein